MGALTFQISVDRYGEVAHTVKQISTSYFADLPERAKDVGVHPVSAWHNQLPNSTLFGRILLAHLSN
jgi:hypothetical protein